VPSAGPRQKEGAGLTVVEYMENCEFSDFAPRNKAVRGLTEGFASRTGAKKY
jgi:hypothetical protein